MITIEEIIAQQKLVDDALMKLRDTLVVFEESQKELLEKLKVVVEDKHLQSAVSMTRSFELTNQ